jgi:hypothetical protein
MKQVGFVIVLFVSLSWARICYGQFGEIVFDPT